MFSVLVVCVYLAAIAVPACLLYQFGSKTWYWHVLALVAGLALGLVPTPAPLSNPIFDMLTGVVFVFLMVWGIGGLVMFRPHQREKHA